MRNQKKYIGITRKDVKERWQNGKGYYQNKKFYKDIQKFGWDEGFTHEIIKDNLSYIEARSMEAELIKKNNSIRNGYNNSDSQLSNLKNFDFYNFNVFNNDSGIYVNNIRCFTKVPNIFIRCNLNKSYGVGRVLLIIFIAIDRYKNFEGISHISIGQILSICNYKATHKKAKVFYEIIKCLLFLKENEYIDFDFDPYLISYNDMIEIKIYPNNFIPQGNFTMIYWDDFDFIMNSKTIFNKEPLLLTFLYICSYIGCRPRNDDGTEKLPDPSDSPEAFFHSLTSMATGLAMSKSTISQCIDFLTGPTENHNALLIKKEMNDEKTAKAFPNIYVLNKEGYQREIKWAQKKLREIYSIGINQ